MIVSYIRTSTDNRTQYYPIDTIEKYCDYKGIRSEILC